jgi:hypothetical protein
VKILTKPSSNSKEIYSSSIHYSLFKPVSTAARNGHAAAQDFKLTAFSAFLGLRRLMSPWMIDLELYSFRQSTETLTLDQAASVGLVRSRNGSILSPRDVRRACMFPIEARADHRLSSQSALG